MRKYLPRRAVDAAVSSRATVVVALLALLASAGCVGLPGGTPTAGPSETPTRTASAASTPTADGSTFTDCPPVLHVGTVEDVPADATVIPHEELSADRRAEFDEARRTGDAELDRNGEGYAFWVDRPYVRYDGTVYDAAVAVC